MNNISIDNEIMANEARISGKRWAFVDGDDNTLLFYSVGATHDERRRFSYLCFAETGHYILGVTISRATDEIKINFYRKSDLSYGGSDHYEFDKGVFPVQFAGEESFEESTDFYTQIWRCAADAGVRYGFRPSQVTVPFRLDEIVEKHAPEMRPPRLRAAAERHVLEMYESKYDLALQSLQWSKY